MCPSTTIFIRNTARFILFAALVLVNAKSFGQAMDDDETVIDNEPLIINMGADDILPPGQRTYSLLTQPEFGTFTWLNTSTGLGSLSVEPQVFFYHDLEVMYFDYQVCVGTYCDTATVEVLLRFRNDNPFANNDTLYVETGTGRWGDVTPNDGDVDSLADPYITGDYMNWQVIPPSHVDTNISPIDSFPKFFGTFYYHPLPNFIGEDFFTYYSQEPNPCLLPSNPARVTIFVVPSNENPIAGDASIPNAVEEETITYNLLSLTSDPENEELHFALAEQPSGGAASINSLGQLTYTSTNNFIGWDTVAYTVMDLVGQLDTGYIYIQVANGNNDAPLLQNSTANAQEDASASWSIATPDIVDGDALSYQIVNTSSLGQYTVSSNGTITYTPPANFSGTDLIRYRACDAGGLCDTAQIVVTIAPVNDAPIAANDFNTTIINGSVTGQVGGNDSDIDNTSAQLAYILLDAPLNGTVVMQANGTYTYSPNELYYGEDLFTYRVCDNQGLCDDADVIINVLYTNLAPETADFNAATAEDESVLIDLSAVSNDFNGGDLSFNLLTNSTFGEFTSIVNTGFNFIPAEDISGTYELSYRVCDTGNLCDTALLTINITAVNDAPAVEPQTIFVLEDTPIAWIPAYSDIDSDNSGLTLEVVEYPQHGTLLDDNTYQGDTNYFGEDAITFHVCDAEGACTSVTHTIVVEAVNDAPVATGETYSILEDSATGVMPLNINDTDIDGDPLQYFLLSEPGEHTINFSISGLMAINSAENFNGIITLDYAVCDGSGLCDTSAVAITVIPVNDLPQSNFPVLQAIEDSSVAFEPAPYVLDVDGDAVSYSIVSSQGVAATFDPETQTYLLSPVADFFGEASVVIQVCDGEAPCPTDTLHIQIEPVNDAPVVSDIEVFTFVNIPAEGELLGFVSDVDDISFTALVENNLNGNLTIDSNLHFSYIPSVDFVGVNSLLITVCDSSGLCDTALFMIEVFPPNQAPQAADATFETCQAQSFAIPIASLVTDDAQSAEDLSYFFSSSSPAQIMVTTPATEAVIIPTSFFTGLLTIDMIVCDNASPALCDTAQYQLEVVPAFTPEITGIALNNVNCNGANDGSLMITGTNDINQTTFVWSNGLEGSSITDLTPGDYAVTITSTTPCSLSGSAAFTISEPELLEATFTAGNISDNSNGSIDVIISGGTAPYDVTWTGPDGFSSTAISLSNLGIGGMYQASISDANDCTTNLEVMITGEREHVVSTFAVYPNPVEVNNLQVTLPAAMALPCTYSINDLSGKLILSGIVNGYNENLDIRELAAGCYMLSIGDHTVRIMRR